MFISLKINPVMVRRILQSILPGIKTGQVDHVVYWLKTTNTGLIVEMRAWLNDPKQFQDDEDDRNHDQCVNPVTCFREA
jgi:hypothetical protein